MLQIHYTINYTNNASYKQLKCSTHVLKMYDTEATIEPIQTFVTDDGVGAIHDLKLNTRYWFVAENVSRDGGNPKRRQDYFLEHILPEIHSINMVNSTSIELTFKAPNFRLGVTFCNNRYVVSCTKIFR